MIGLESKIFFLDSIFLKRCFEIEKDVNETKGYILFIHL